MTRRRRKQQQQQQQEPQQEAKQPRAQQQPTEQKRGSDDGSHQREEKAESYRKTRGECFVFADAQQAVDVVQPNKARRVESCKHSKLEEDEDTDEAEQYRQCVVERLCVCLFSVRYYLFLLYK